MNDLNSLYVENGKLDIKNVKRAKKNIESLYGPKPTACPLCFTTCGQCNVYPCFLTGRGGPAVARIKQNA